MAMYRRLLTICAHVMKDLLDDEDFKLLVKLLNLRVAFYSPERKLSDWSEIHIQAQELAKTFVTAAPEVFDRSVVHFPCEAACKDGPTWWVVAVGCCMLVGLIEGCW